MQKDTQAEIARLEARLDGLKDILAEREKFASASAQASNRALDVALDAQKHVNEGQNEFRAQSKDFARELVDRVETRVSALERGMSGGAGRVGGIASAKADIVSIIALLFSLATLVILFMKK